MIKIKNGDKFNKLTFVEYSDERYDRRISGLFICDCGKWVLKPICRVTSNKIKSCGCLLINNKSRLTHGMKYTKEYSSWQSCLDRMRNPKCKDYKKYSLLNNDLIFMSIFENFFNEVGYAPSKKHSIDRIDNNQGYRKGNIKWSNRSEQQKNKSNSYDVEIKGMTFDCFQSAADYFNVKKQTIHKWCNGHIDSKTKKRMEKKKWATATLKYQK